MDELFHLYNRSITKSLSLENAGEQTLMAMSILPNFVSQESYQGTSHVSVSVFVSDALYRVTFRVLHSVQITAFLDIHKTLKLGFNFINKNTHNLLLHATKYKNLPAMYDNFLGHVHFTK